VDIIGEIRVIVLDKVYSTKDTGTGNDGLVHCYSKGIIVNILTGRLRLGVELAASGYPRDYEPSSEGFYEHAMHGHSRDSKRNPSWVS
jgi:hypothetical protein